MIADALAVFQPEEEEEEEEEETLETAIHYLQMKETSKLTDIEEAIDKHYNAIVLAIKTVANFKQLPGHHPACKLLIVCDQLSIAKLGETYVILLDGRRIVVPKGARKNIIKELHCAHSGLTKTFKMAKQLYFWPNRKEELCKAIDACQHCQEDRPTQARPTLKWLVAISFNPANAPRSNQPL